MFGQAIRHTACAILSLMVFAGGLSASEDPQQKDTSETAEGQASTPSIQDIDALIASVEALIGDQDQKLIDLHEKIEAEEDEDRRRNLFELQSKTTAMLDQLDQQLSKIRQLRAQHPDTVPAQNQDGDNQ